MNFISDFLDRPAPAECAWMEPYFGGPAGRDFLKYFHIFRSSVHFSEHVGRVCCERWMKRMKSRFLRLERARAEARKNMDMELLAEIELGEFKLK